MLASPERPEGRRKLHIRTADVFEPLLQPARYKGAYGGRGSGKSHFFAELLVETCILQLGTAAVCIREVQRTLTQSAKRLIEQKIQQLGVGPLFRILDDRIETPGKGVIIFQGMQDHTAESIKSWRAFASRGSRKRRRSRIAASRCCGPPSASRARRYGPAGTPGASRTPSTSSCAVKSQKAQSSSRATGATIRGLRMFWKPSAS